MEILFPTIEHRFCVKHIYNNFKLNFKGLELKAALWRCATVTTVREFILGDERLQYGKLRDYAEMIRVTDVGSKVILQTENTEPNTQPKFKRMYVRYNA